MKFSPIAIVGRSCVLPGALSPEELWRAVSSGQDLLSTTPKGRWRANDADVLCKPDADSANRSWSNRGGYVKGFEQVWDPSGYGVSAEALNRLDPVFLWSLYCARQALANAGDTRKGKVARDRVCAIFGNLGFPSASMSAFAESVWLDETKGIDAQNRFMSSGAARVLQEALGLGPDVFCLDTACASSLYAIELACAKLHDGRADIALAGGVSCSDDLFIHVGFTALKALSKTGQSRPFHAQADGLVPAEGAAFVALKRLEDARRDGDQIYGVIRGIGLSNDGRGRGFLAPEESGQVRALKQAYKSSGVKPEEITLLECHATGTSVGDRTEILSTGSQYESCKEIPIGSLKSNLGHLITAAGAAGLIKVLEAMRNQQRPPSLHANVPNPALADSPFRVIQKTESWDSTGPRIAGVSAFGFGGNNAHLIVSEDDPSITAPAARTESKETLAIVGIGTVVGTAQNREEFTQTLLNGESLIAEQEDGSSAAKTKDFQLSLPGLRFPPNDLKATLPQQLLLLKAAREAVDQTKTLPTEKTGVFVGMEPDTEVCRFGLRWRQAQRLRDKGLDPNAYEKWLNKTGDAIVPTLTSAGVVGNMPNIPANRLNSQLDLGAASYSISSGETSGTKSLSIACRALQNLDIDAAVVGAVDLSCEQVHKAALSQIEETDSILGDASVVLVIKRLTDAQNDGDEIIAVIDESPIKNRQTQNLNHRFGRSWTAGSLRDFAASAICTSHGMDLDGKPLAVDAETSAKPVFLGAEHLTLRAYDSPKAALPVPRIYSYSGSNRAELLKALKAGQTSLKGESRLVVVANHDLEHQSRVAKAIAHLEKGLPLGPGIYFHERAIGGDVAFVFGGAGAAYEGMGRALLQAMPQLKSDLHQHSKKACEGLLQAWLPDEKTPPLQRLWSSSGLCQLHALLSQNLLKLKADAVIGYSSGESNSLFATGTWTDMDAMIQETSESEVFVNAIGGRFDVVRQAWGLSNSIPDEDIWQTWTVLAPVDEVIREVEQREHVFVSIIHTDNDCIIVGRPQECQEIIKHFGAHRCLRLHYDLAVHVPLVEAVKKPWFELHRRTVTRKDGLRVYSSGPSSCYEVSSDACAQAILGQAQEAIDFRQVVERAYADGARVFVEHGPQSHCARWIREILKDRPAVVVSFDSKGKGLETLIEAVAALTAAGVHFDSEAIMNKLMPPTPSHQPELSFDAHRAPVNGVDLPVPQGQVLPSAPALVPTGRNIPSKRTPAAVTSVLPSTSPAPVAPLPMAAAPATNITPATSSPTNNSSGALNQPEFSSDPRLDALRQQILLMGQVEQNFIQQQTHMHQQFLAMQDQSMQILMRGRTAPTIEVPSIPAADVNPVTPTAQVPSVPKRLEPAIAVPAPTEPAPLTSPTPKAVEVKPALPSPKPIDKEAPSISDAPKAVNLESAKTAPEPTGLTFDFEQLKIHASGKISEIYGDMFKVQDDYHRQVRMPEPPLLLADRVTGLDAVPGKFGKGTIWSESNVEAHRWFMHQGHMPASIMIESGQADLMLISYMGVDFTNQGERVYRLLGCELTYHGGLPKTGDIAKYDIHMDGHATQGDVRLMFFHSDCRIDDEVRLSVRKGQAGFFTDEELANSDGCLWTPEEQEIVPQPRLDKPFVECEKSNFSLADVRAFADGQTHNCFGEGFELSQTHTRTPRIQNGPMLLLGDVTELSNTGGPWGRGYAKSTVEITPDIWFFDGHFKNDPCMPGTLMFEGCLQLMSFFLASQGYTLQRDGWRFEPVSDEPFQLSCRGQVTPNSKKLTYELFVEEVFVDGVPKVYADLLCTVDGLKAFHARRVGVQLTPAWPLDEGSDLLEGYVEPKDVAKAGDFPFDYRSLVACANGKPSEAFGPIYERFDGPGRVARLPNPPYHFLSRVTRTKGLVGSMSENMEVDVEYDIPQDAWYFEENGCRAMPFAVLLEAALQPCGWLASYMGCALTTDTELCFRNLDGTGTLLVDVLPDSGTLLTKVRNTGTSKTGSMIIVSFEVECSVEGKPVYELETVFGFFPQSALENQIGLSTTPEQRQLFETAGTKTVDLTVRPEAYWKDDRPKLAEPMLLMLDRVTCYDATGGKAGLGFARGEKDVNPAEWFFKAHFFQDPVQPGSLGIEAMIQLLQWTMLEQGLDQEIENPRFETLALNEAMTWKYRGQVIPANSVISSTLEITEVIREDDSVIAKAEASLWVDGKRIYEASNLGMRIVSGGTPDKPTRTLDPKVDTWLNDHCPTWTAPALPMMSMVDLLAQGACSAEPVTALEDVRVTGWMNFDGPRNLKTIRRGNLIELIDVNEDGTENLVASAKVRVGAYSWRPDAWPALEGDARPLPYDSGELFHGPAFQVLESLIRTKDGASSVLRAESAVPAGRLNPALLDGATHGIPHDNLQLWDDRFSADKVAYPALITKMNFYGATPKTGTIRCEVRPDGILGSVDFPAFKVQLIGDEGVWCTFQLIESCFPKGALGSAPASDRMSFLKDRQFIEGLGLSQAEGDSTKLLKEDVAAVDWLPGTVETIYGTRDEVSIAEKEHLARTHRIHPSKLPHALPLQRFELTSENESGQVTVSGDPSGSLDITPVRKFWSEWFNRGPWPVEDLYYGLIERFVGKVVIEDPDAFRAVQGRSLLYLGNHQVGVESLLFSIIASALSEVPTVTLAKAEHRTTWLGQLIDHCFKYPGVKDPKVIAFFDRQDKASLPAILEDLARDMAGPGRSVMVHVEGTRSLDCTTPVQKMSGAFIDMALAVNAPVVPIRFVGALPRETMEKRIEFPIGFGKQDIYFGKPILPETMSKLHYGGRKELVINAINKLGPANEIETPYSGDVKFANTVADWQSRHPVSEEHAVLRSVLQELKEPGEEVQKILSAKSCNELDDGEAGPWLTELGKRLIGK